MRQCPSTHTLHPLIWLARRHTSSTRFASRPAPPTAAPKACSASIAPGTTYAGCSMRGSMAFSFSVVSHRPTVGRHPYDDAERKDVTVTDDTLNESFEASRPRLHAIAARMLGSDAEADDAVQETWLRASRAGTDDVDNIDGWLTTITSRVCLDVLRSRTRAAARAMPADAAVTVPSPEEDAVLADAIGPALLVVLDTLTPPERLAFVLHDLFAVPFDEMAAILQRSPAAARQLASRARRRVQGADREADPERERPIVDAFLAASRVGDFAALVALLDPDAVYRADEAAAAFDGVPVLVGAGAVAQAFMGRATTAVS